MNADSATRARWRLVEIWGDTADLGHLGWSIVIGVAVSLAGYLVASRVLASAVGTPELARAYAMLQPVLSTGRKVCPEDTMST